MIPNRIRLGLAVALAALAAGASRGAGGIEFRRIDPRCTHVSAPGITALAVDERAQWLAVGFGSGSAPAIALPRLDPRGGIAEDSTPVPSLPAAPGPENAGAIVALMFHPVLPVLYAWRQAPPDGDGETTDAAASKSFAHLLVYDLSRPEQPELRGAFARGDTVSAGRRPAHMAISKNGRRLYVPNLQIHPERGAPRAAVGYIPLDNSGTPLLSKDRMRVETVDVSGFQSQPTGRGFVPAGDRVLLMAAQNGVLTWDTVDRRAELSRLLLPGLPGPDGFVGGDENRVYWVSEGRGHVRAIRHVKGFPTLLPERHVLPDAAFHSPPIVLGGDSPALAVGGKGGVHRIGLNAEGGFSGKDRVLRLDGSAPVSFLAYASRIPMLYVAMEKQP